ncbi:type VI secretion system lipoprotein TssJ [Rodentibacter sp. Ppn85]|uniref:type VI secretion system lipoprotein TssJ n=1 Tax=Rodentibacter sp. Ppn85 TaxID=1908525 RepID=UPI0009863891|nr:type VI secretion system lipoprotein TssJ [Rodentibacter sp. Ppn85]OOF66677.1 type VI secretion system-associated lipoprotein [Rodentibacter sp. Ppn85]
MKLKPLFILTTALTITACSSNEPSVNPRLLKASTYSLSIYATDRANINVYSPKDDSVAVVSDEASAEFEEVLDVSKSQVKRPMTTTEYRKNVTANSSNSDKQIIEQENGKADARATPVMLKVFQLTDKSLFLSSTYDDFRGNDFTDSLGKTYVSNIDLIVAPNQFRFVDSEAMNEKTHYIGVVALFNGYENRKWKGIVQVKPKGGESYPLLIRVLDSKVEIYKDN